MTFDAFFSNINKTKRTIIVNNNNNNWRAHIRIMEGKRICVIR